jgi:hypothetical protein
LFFLGSFEAKFFAEGEFMLDVLAHYLREPGAKDG